MIFSSTFISSARHGFRLLGSDRLATALLIGGMFLCEFTSSVAADSVHPDIWPVRPPRFTDAAAEAFAAKILGQMTLEEKVGQMIQADIASITPAELRTYRLGSVLAGGNAAPGGNVRTGPRAWLDLTDSFHDASRANPATGHPAIPILFGIDAVHGHAKIIGATIFPHNVGLGAAHDPDLVRRIGAATAEEVASTGIDWTFAPTVAVARDVRWGRSYESYSESPDLVAQYAPAMVTGLQGRFGTPQFMSPGHTLSSVKHFLGDGGTLGGRDQGDAIVTEAELSSVHGAGYPSAIAAGALIVMASYNSWNGSKLHANRYLLTEILKGRFGFQGFVVGDWNAHEEIPGCTKYRCAAAILAGVDMLMAPDSWKELLNNTVAQANSGEIPIERIDDAVRRILRVKYIAGTFHRPALKRSGDAEDFTRLGSAAHRSLAREAVRKSLVLLKNERSMLPLNPKAKIMVAGEAADSIGTQCGGWTIDWQGDRNSNADFPGATSIYGGIKAAVAAAGGSVILSSDGKFVDKPDAAIVVFGEKPYAEFQGDRENLRFSPDDDRALGLLLRLRAAGVPTVSVFLSGRPLWVNPQINASDAFVAAWLPGSEGEGIADMLFRSPGVAGDDFTGRLAFSWPKTAMPVTFDAAGTAMGALFTRGYGLHYRSPPAAAVLPEAPAVPPEWDPPPGSLFRAGHVTAPWSLFVADDIAEVHLTTRRQASPRGGVEVSADRDGASMRWPGTENGIVRISGHAVDLRAGAADGTALVARYRVDTRPAGTVKAGMPGAMFDVTKILAAATPGAWHSLSLPLACMQADGVDLARVEVPFAIETAGQFGITVTELSLSRDGSIRLPGCP